MRADILNSVHSLDPLVSWTWLRALPYLALASSFAAADGYFVHNFDSDLPGVADQQQDTLIGSIATTVFETNTMFYDFHQVPYFKAFHNITPS
jgi:hypothetical protein